MTTRSRLAVETNDERLQLDGFDYEIRGGNALNKYELLCVYGLLIESDLVWQLPGPWSSKANRLVLAGTCSGRGTLTVAPQYDV